MRLVSSTVSRHPSVIRRFVPWCRLALAGFVLLSGSRLPAEDWPQWRGPDGQGHATTTGLPLTWSEQANVAWKTAVPGRGWSSPVIGGSQIWMTTAVETPAKPEDAQRRLKTNTGDQPLTLLERVELRAVCFDRDSGNILHNVLLIDQRDPQWVHALNSYASPSPVLDGGKLYCHFGAFGTAGVDTRTGKLEWTNTELPVMHENGPGGSPVVVGDYVVVQLDGSDDQFVAAIDKRTGKTAWKTARSGEMRSNPQFRKSYGTPLVLEIGGNAEIVSPASDWVYGYDPKSGRELWKVGYGELGFSLTPRPVAGHGRIFMSTGYGKSQILALRVTGDGSPQIDWRYTRGAPTMPSPILVGNELYFVSDNGILTCLDALTGKEHYRERLSGNFSSSPIAADGRIYVGNREGSMFVVEPGSSFKLLAENKLPGGIFATPAAVAGAIFLRTDKELYKLQVSKS